MGIFSDFFNGGQDTSRDDYDPSRGRRAGNMSPDDRYGNARYGGAVTAPQAFGGNTDGSAFSGGVPPSSGVRYATGSAVPAPPSGPYSGASGAFGPRLDASGKPVASFTDQTGEAAPWELSDNTRKNLLNQQAGLASKSAGQSQANYNQLGQQGQGALNGLARIASGQDSVSAEQLRQGVQQQQAGQMSMAASNPQSPMAARTAAIQYGRAGSGLSGQQAVAGLQERNQAQGQYAGLLQGLRGQDAQAIGTARGQAMSGYGGNIPPPPPGKSAFETYGPAVIGGIAAASDRRLKKDIEDGDADSAKVLKGLKSYSFKYKDGKLGEGKRVGIMAQDLERAGLKHAVIDTPRGKMVHGAHLATSLAAMMPGIAKRLDKLEGARK